MTSTDSKYRKVSPVEHVLLRPEMYVGSVEAATHKLWVVKSEKKLAESSLRMEFRAVNINSGLLKIFDEILLNSADNFHRSKGTKHAMTYIDVKIDDEGRITIKNDGEGIPITVHSEHGLLIPDMIFGHLLTSSNYDNSSETIAAGRHGYGAKLTNIFSKSFAVTAQCGGKHYVKTWTRNMRDTQDAVTTNLSGKTAPSTEVSFLPDYPLFKCEGLTPDMKLAMFTRCVDLAAALPDVALTVNGNRITADFGTYVEAFGRARKSGHSKPFTASHEGRGSSYRFGVTLSDSPGKHVSMVNGVVTVNGGTHVDTFEAQLQSAADAAALAISKAEPGLTLNKRKFIAHCTLVLTVEVTQPKFDSQNKVRLVSQHRYHALDAEAFVAWIMKLPDLDTFKQSEHAGVDKAMKSLLSGQGSRNRPNLPKLADAKFAGVDPEGQPCTLIVTEGDSAKALAVSSLSAEQKLTYGVFPLRGKVLNVRNNAKLLADNKELQELMLALGVKPSDREPKPLEMRYQRIMIMADQDHDGSHIKGLLLSNLEVLFPSLLLTPGFVTFFYTPLLKVKLIGGSKVEGEEGGPKKAKGAGGRAIPFQSMEDFEKWTQANKGARFTVKYYKGLGTSGAEEGREYFSNLQDHQLVLNDVNPSSRNVLAKAFATEEALWRRTWISNVSASNTASLISNLPKTAEGRMLPLPLFVNNELIHFAVADNYRALPCYIDGLKPSLRKILWATLHRSDNAEIKVSQLAGHVARVAEYHHGEASLLSSIVRMAQDFCGAPYGLPFLTAIGQFGTRLALGDDHSAPRYIFTKVHPLARLLFPKEDDDQLRYELQDGVLAEPVNYVPVVPLVLINGSRGIGIGYAASFVGRSPNMVIELTEQLVATSMKATISDKSSKDAKTTDATMKALTKELEAVPMDSPGFRGTVLDLGNGAWQSIGCVSIHEATAPGHPSSAKEQKLCVARVTEVPLGCSVEAYRVILQKLVSDGTIVRFDDFSSGIAVDMDVYIQKSAIGAWFHENGGGMEAVREMLQLSARRTKSGTNHTGYDSAAVLQSHGASFAPIWEEYFQVRLELYTKRKAKVLQGMRNAATIVSGEIRFHADLSSGKLQLFRADVAALETFFTANKYPRDPEADDFEYLTKRPIVSLTKTRSEALKEKAAQLATRITQLEARTPHELWLDDLKVLKAATTSHIAERVAAIDADLAAREFRLAPFDPATMPPSPSKGGDGGEDGGGAADGSGSGDGAPPPPPSGGKGKHKKGAAAPAATGQRLFWGNSPSVAALWAASLPAVAPTPTWAWPAAAGAWRQPRAAAVAAASAVAPQRVMRMLMRR